MNGLRFFWNGIKVGTGKLQRCWYSDGQITNHPAGTITIYHREYWPGFSPEVREAFKVENQTDITTDYCERDYIRVTPDHPLYPQVAAALKARNAHYERVA